jgi:hypothetical protein
VVSGVFDHASEEIAVRVKSTLRVVIAAEVGRYVRDRGRCCWLRNKHTLAVVAALFDLDVCFDCGEALVEIVLRFDLGVRQVSVLDLGECLRAVEGDVRLLGQRGTGRLKFNDPACHFIGSI